jgi:hypothetical protein
MTNPGPPGEDERPLAGPPAGMGLPESGTQHATSTDIPLPVDPATPATPVTRAYDEPTGLLDPVPDVEPTELAAPTPAYDELAAESGFDALAPADAAGGAGVLAKVKAFADERPAAFLAAALLAGWLVGKLLGSFGDDDEDES